MISDRVLGALGLLVAAAMAAGLALPFWQTTSVWEFHTQVPWAMPILVAGFALILGSGIAAMRGGDHRVTGGAIAIGSLAIVLQVLSDFVPLFDTSPGVIEALFSSGAVGANVLFIAGVVGVLTGVVGLVGRGRRAA